MSKEHKFGKSSEEELSTVTMPMQKIARRALLISPVDFGLPKDAGRRTAERQNVIFKRGDSLLDGFIDKSDHQSGRALDFCAYIGRYTWDLKYLEMIGFAFYQAADIEGYVIEWGRHYTGYGPKGDAGHVSYRGVK